MSENVSITESGKTRNFSGIGVIETETPEGDSCFWVPESERELETEYVIKNGTYRPKKYGFSDIHVNVFDLTTDLDGNDWKIDIGDIDMPDISLPDFDIDLSLDLNGMPNIDFGIHIITVDDDEIRVVLPGGEEIIIHGPSLTDPVVILDAIKINYDPSTGEWTVTALVDCTVGDTTYNPGDIIKTWPGTEKVDFYIHARIALPDLSETIDLDAGFDVSLDVDDASSLDDIGIDISGSDLDGLPIDVNINLGTLDIETTDLPDEIRIMHVPDKTTYQDGEPIDLEGIVVQAYRDGEVWTSEKYPDGYIPVHELTIDPEIAQYTGKNPFIEKDDYRFYSYGRIAGEGYYYSPGDSGRPYPPVDIQFIPFEGTLLEIYQNKYRYQGETWRYAIFQGIMYGKDLNFDNPPPTKELGVIVQNGVVKKTIIGGRINPLLNPYYRKPFYSAYSDLYREFYTGTVGYNAFDFIFDPEIQSASGGGHDGEAAYDILYGEDEPTKKTTSKVSVSWPRPHDSRLLTASFDITVEENDGAAQSNEESNGGTTISGNYGGSHHSGKF